MTVLRRGSLRSRGVVVLHLKLCSGRESRPYLFGEVTVAVLLRCWCAVGLRSRRIYPLCCCVSRVSTPLSATSRRRRRLERRWLEEKHTSSCRLFLQQFYLRLQVPYLPLRIFDDPFDGYKLSAAWAVVRLGRHVFVRYRRWWWERGGCSHSPLGRWQLL